MDKINKIVERTAVIIEISRKYKDFIFNIDNVKKIIELSINLILSKIIEISKL